MAEKKRKEEFAQQLAVVKLRSRKSNYQ